MAVKALEQQRTVTREFGGLTAVHMYRVTDVENEDAALDEADVPRPGDPYPGAGFAIVKSVSAQPAGGRRVFDVTVNYGPRDADSGADQPTPPGTTGIIELGVASTVVRTSQNVKGEQVVLRHTYRETLATGEVTSRTERQSAEVEFEQSQLVLIQRRVETVAPVAKSLYYSNTVNSRRIWGFERGTLFCHPITASSNDGGVSYQVTYQFQASDTWLARALFKDKKTGKPPIDLVEAQGSALVQVYEETDFRRLGLQFPGFF